MPDVSLLVGHDRHPDEWRRAHACGEVPGELFYGLEALRDHGFTPRSLSPPAATTSGRLAARLVGPLGWTPVPDLPADVPVLAWSEDCGIPAAVARRGPPVATGVIWLTDGRLPAPARRAARAGLRRAGAVWVLSGAQLPVLRDTWAVPASRLHHVVFGVDTSFWSPRDTEGVEPDLVVAVGNDRHRDFPVVVRAVAGLRGRGRPVRTEFVTGSDAVGPADVDVLHRRLPHVGLRALYGRAGVVVVPAGPNVHVSGMTVVLEAGAMARPVVATRTPGIEDYVDDGRTGVLVPPGDPDALATAVGGLLADPDRAAAMGAAARAQVLRCHTHATQAAQLAEVLRTT